MVLVKKLIALILVAGILVVSTIGCSGSTTTGSKSGTGSGGSTKTEK
jgi:hypothetical protein